MIFITDAALARSVHTPIYVSIKAGLGDTTIYVDNDTKLGDFWSKIVEIINTMRLVC